MTCGKYLGIAAFCSTIAHSAEHAAFPLTYIAILLNLSLLTILNGGVTGLADGRRFRVGSTLPGADLLLRRIGCSVQLRSVA